MRVFQQASGSPDRAYPNPHCLYVECRSVYGPSALDLTRSLWGGIVVAPADDPRAEEVQTISRGSKGRYTQSAPPPGLLRTTSLEATRAFTLACTSNQFRSSWRSGPSHTTRMRTGPSLQRRDPGRVSLPARHRFCQNWPWLLLFVRIQQPPFHSLYVQEAGHKDSDVIGKHGNPYCKRASKRDTMKGKICPLIPKPSEQGLQSEDIEKRREGNPCRTDRSITNAPERLPFTCTTAWGLWYIMLIHQRNSGLNPAVLKTDAKNRWSTPWKALDWSRLISAVLVPSFNPSRISQFKCRLSWINLPFIA